MGKRKTQKEYIQQCKEMHGDKYDYTNTIYTGIKNNITVYCNKHQKDFTMLADSHLRGRGCQLCANESRNKNRQLDTEEFIRRAKEIHGTLYTYKHSIYTKYKANIIITCPIHGDFTIPVSSILAGHGCQKCAAEKTSKRCRKTTEQFIKDARKIHGDRYDYSLVEYTTSKEKIKIRCIIHDHIWDANPRDHLSGCGCPLCGGTMKKTTEKFIEDAVAVHGKEVFDYVKVDYISDNKKVKIVCNTCGITFNQCASSHLQGVGCPSCKQSKGEKRIQRYLNTCKCGYEIQKWFPECRNILPLPFDFYIPSINLLIEYQGEQHHKYIRYGGISIEQAKENFKAQQIRDNIKRKFCQENNISLLEIDYWDFDNIEHILNKTIRRE